MILYNLTMAGRVGSQLIQHWLWLNMCLIICQVTLLCLIFSSANFEVL